MAVSSQQMERVQELYDLYQIGNWITFTAEDTDIPYLQPQVILEGIVIKKCFTQEHCNLVVKIGGTEIQVDAEKVR